MDIIGQQFQCILDFQIIIISQKQILYIEYKYFYFEKSVPF